MFLIMTNWYICREGYKPLNRKCNRNVGDAWLNGMHIQRAYPTSEFHLENESLSKKCRVRMGLMRTNPSRLNGMHTLRTYPTDLLDGLCVGRRKGLLGVLLRRTIRPIR